MTRRGGTSRHKTFRCLICGRVVPKRFGAKHHEKCKQTRIQKKGLS